MIHVDPNSRLGNIILAIGFPIFAAFLWLQSLNFSRAFFSMDWPSTVGRILESKMERVYTMEGAHPSAKIRYSYVVKGKRFENDTVAFGLFRGILTPGYFDRKLSRFPAGKEIPVYYDPESPGVSCLEKGGIGWEDCLMLPVCGGGLVLGFKRVCHFARLLFAKWGRRKSVGRPAQSNGPRN